MLVSAVIPVKNGSPFIEECLQSLLDQDFSESWEVSLFDDGSTDNTPEIYDKFRQMFSVRSIGFNVARGEISGGVGFAKNRAVELSTGKYLCFCDADDVSSPSRLRTLCEAAENITSIGGVPFLGSCFHRLPAGSTERYSRWANNLTGRQLMDQIFTSHGPTLIAPSWFISRKLFDSVGGFNEDHKTGYPEDLDFFFKATLLADVKFMKLDSDLVTYRYHPTCASLGVSESSIWNMRLKHLRKLQLNSWTHFTIWSAGKQGKRFFKSLTVDEKAKVVQFCDVDEKKIRHGWYEEYDEKARKVTNRIPIVSIKCARPPLIVCVKLDMTGGDLERLIDESGWQEGLDYVLFS